MRRTAKLLLILFVLVFTVSCSSTLDSNKTPQKNGTPAVTSDGSEIMDSGPVNGGTLKIFSTKPDTLNPLLTSNVFVQDFSNMIFEGLVSLDKDQHATPALSDKWDVSSDGLVWTFHIRENVLWHDNMPLTAEDVKFTFDAIQNKAVDNIYRNNIQNVVLYTALDKNNFRIFLKEPNSFTAEMMTFPIIPEHYYNNGSMGKLDSQKNMNPIGTGPYKYTSDSDSNTIRLAVNDKWWNSKVEGDQKLRTPYINNIEVKIYPDSKDAIRAFQTRDVDVAMIQTCDFSKYSGRSDLVIKKYTSKDYDFLAFNLSNPALSDKVVRQAIAYAINKTEIINHLIPGQAVAADIPIIPGTWLYNSNIVSYNPDPAVAKNLLLQNGWKDNGGVMSKTIKGVKVPLKFEILVNDYNDTRYKVVQKISDQLKEIGIVLTIKKVQWQDELKAIRTKKFDIALVGNRVTSIPDISFAFSSSGAANGFNVSGYNSPLMDNYLTQIKSENSDDRKSALYTSMRALINDDVPYIGLCFYNYAVLYSKKLRGELSPSVWNRYGNVTKWYISDK